MGADIYIYVYIFHITSAIKKQRGGVGGSRRGRLLWRGWSGPPVGLVPSDKKVPECPEQEGEWAGRSGITGKVRDKRIRLRAGKFGMFGEQKENLCNLSTEEKIGRRSKGEDVCKQLQSFADQGKEFKNRRDVSETNGHTLSPCRWGRFAPECCESSQIQCKKCN